MSKKFVRSTIIPCVYTTCKRGTLCPNFTPKPTKNSYSFPSCMYNPVKLFEDTKEQELMHANK